MSFLTETAARRLATLQLPRVVATSAPRAAFSSTVMLQKSAVDSAKETASKVHRKASDIALDGIEIGGEFHQPPL